MSRSVSTNGRPASPRTRHPARQVSRGLSDNQYRVLLSQLYSLGYGEQGQLRTLGLTSSKRREGVTTVACNLALYAAKQHGLRVLLIDANHANPSLHKVFNVPYAPGLTDLLNADVSEDDCTHDLSKLPLDEWPHALQYSLRRSRGVGRFAKRRETTNAPQLTVMPCGRSDLLSHNIGRVENDGVLNGVSAEYDLAIVDLPAISLATSSGFSPASLDGIVVVIKSNATSDVSAQKSLRQMQQAGGDVMGVVLNQCRSHLPKWLDAKLGD